MPYLVLGKEAPQKTDEIPVIVVFMTVKNSEVYAVNKLNGRKSHVIQKSKPT